ncbi:MAG: GldG family protein [Peptococcaceae bacterium]|jgi:hypothetical protein|nr:GldG family protein [Peptococcaceae bacterium]
MLNVVVNLLSERFALRLDLTAEKMFVVSDETKAFLNAIDTDIQIYVLTRESVLVSSGYYYTQANEILRQFGALCPRLSLRYIDLARAPGFDARYPQFQLDASTVLFESPERVVAININDMFNIESGYNSDYQLVEYVDSSHAEQTIVGALVRLLNENPAVVSILSGYGEQPADALENLLASSQYDIVRQNLLTEPVSREAAAAVICAPSQDYTEDALRKLDEFLYNGGHFGKLLFYITGARASSTPNLDTFLADWGIAAGDGVIYQDDSKFLITNSPYWSVVTFSEEVLSKSVIDRRLIIIMPEAKPLTALFDNKESKSVIELLAYSDTAYLQPTDSPESWRISDSTSRGPFPVMLLSRHKATVDGEVKYSSVLASGSILMAGEELLAIPQLGNSEYIRALFLALAPQPSGLSIAPKSADSAAYLPLSEFQILLMAAFFVVILPLGIIIAGCVVFLRTRHL